jgi:hypothetical protein
MDAVGKDLPVHDGDRTGHKAIATGFGRAETGSNLGGLIMKSRILNVLMSQVGWFACVLGAANDRPWTGCAIIFALIVIHLLLVKDRGNELRLLLAATLLGILFDTLQEALGVVRFRSGYIVDWLCPLWIALLWTQFATLLHISLNWLSGRYLLAGLVGLIGGPLAFFGGARLGAAILHPNLLFSLVAFALEWAVAMPLMLWLAGRFAVSPGYRLLDPDPV